MESSIISGILAQALVELPKIIMADLYTRCEGKIGTTTLAQFRVAVAEWIKDGTIPGYESRKGPHGGIYKKGAPNVRTNTDTESKVELDPAPISEFICKYLETHPRITMKELIQLVDIAPLTEIQFKKQMSDWLNDGSTFPLFGSRMGPTGGIYLHGAETEKFVPSEREPNEDGSEPEHVGGFAVKITPSLRIHHEDDRNWTIQKLCGETWQNKAYHTDIGSCIKSVVKHAINGEFKCSNSLVQLKDLLSAFQQMEARLMSQIEKAVQVQV